MDSLAKVRAEIDKVDKELVALLVRRTGLAMEALKYKKDTEAIRGADRVKVVLDKVRELARENGGNEDVVVSVYQTIINELTGLQLERFKENE